MKHYISCEAKCPMYTHEEACELHCLGFDEGMRVHINFGTRGRKNAHKAQFCNLMHEYEKCPFYIAAISGEN